MLALQSPDRLQPQISNTRPRHGPCDDVFNLVDTLTPQGETLVPAAGSRFLSLSAQRLRARNDKCATYAIVVQSRTMAFEVILSAFAQPARRNTSNLTVSLL